MSELTVTCTKESSSRPEWKLTFNNQEFNCFNHLASRALTDTTCECGNGIFDISNRVIVFHRQNATVRIDFGATWRLATYENPALEIKRRVSLVKAAFEVYKKSWTVTLDNGNEYIEKRKAEAAQAAYYFDGLVQYKIQDCLTDDEDENGNDCFSIIIDEEYDDLRLIAFADIPAEAYFLKLARIE